MGHNVQSQAGVSLSDIYDIKGGQAPIERLFTSEVPAVHEMAATIQSERFSQRIRTASALFAASTAIDLLFDTLGAGVSRLHGLILFTDDASRIADICVSIEDTDAFGPDPSRGMPIWVWDATNSQSIRFRNTTMQNLTVLRAQSEFTFLPNIITGGDQPDNCANLRVAGNTTAFGAGTVNVLCAALLSFSAEEGLSSRGLPVPSW